MKIDVSQIKLNKNDLDRNLKIPDVLTKDLAYLAGFISGDGSLSTNRGKNEIVCCGSFIDEKEFFDKIISHLFNKIFGLKVKPIFTSKNTYVIRFSSKGILTLFNRIFKIPVGKKSDKIILPDIFLSSEEFTNSFIQGFADADFSLQLKRRYGRDPYYPVISGVSTSKRMIEQISEYLNKKNISHSLLLDAKTLDRRSNKVCTNHRIHIYGNKNLSRWMENIGFRNPKFVKIANNVLGENSAG